MSWAVLLSVGNFFRFLKKYASPAWLLLPGFERLLAKELERCSLLCVTGCLFLKWENRLVVFPLYLSLVGGSHKAHRTCNTTTSYSINRRWAALQYSTYICNWEAYVAHILLRSVRICSAFPYLLRYLALTSRRSTSFPSFFSNPKYFHTSLVAPGRGDSLYLQSSSLAAVCLVLQRAL